MKTMKLQELVQNIEKQQLKTDVASIKIGDTVKVKVIIPKTAKEKEKEKDSKKKKNDNKKKKNDDKQRIQPYEGTIIAQHRAGLSTSITVRRIFQNIGIERVFCIHSPLIEEIEIIRRAKVRKAKLYYLRTRIGKSTRLKERFN